MNLLVPGGKGAGVGVGLEKAAAAPAVGVGWCDPDSHRTILLEAKLVAYRWCWLLRHAGHLLKMVAIVALFFVHLFSRVIERC